MGDPLRSAADGSQRACELRDGGRKFGAQRNRRLQADDRSLPLAGLEKRAAEVAVSLGERRLERGHASVPVDCSRKRALNAPGIRQVADGGGELRPQRERALTARDRGVRPSQPEQHLTEVVVRLGELRTQNGRASEALGCPVEQSLVLERLPKREQTLPLDLGGGRRIAAAVLELATAAAG